MKIITGTYVKKYRKSLGVNQGKFWRKVFVTQSGGSRYENGRPIPKQIQLLLHALIAGADLRNLVADAVEGRRLREWKKSNPRARGPIMAGGIGPNGMRMVFNRHA